MRPAQHQNDDGHEEDPFLHDVGFPAVVSAAEPAAAPVSAPVEAPAAPAPEVPKAALVCPNCGYKPADGEVFKFCPECGSKVE